MDIRERHDEPEIMDTLECSPAEMAQALRFLALTNRYFGGTRVIQKRLAPLMRKPGSRLTLLDVGCGLGDIGQNIVEWGRAREVDVRITLLDSSPLIIDMARKNAAGNGDAAEFVTADFFDWDAPRSFDCVTASLVLHHLPEEKLLPFLQKCDRIARQGVIFSDLERSRAGYWAVNLASHVLGNRVVQNDGPLSVRRAFKVPELERLAKDAGLPYLKARREGFFRLSLAGEKSFSEKYVFL